MAHPGHELRVHGWLEQVRPEVWVLTDGSGHGDRGRLPSTQNLLARAGARTGRIFGRLSDRAAYSLLMTGDADTLLGLAEELATALVEQQVDYVAGDACEGFNPVHDLCRLVIDTAVLTVGRRNGRDIADFEFALEGGPTWRGGGDELAWTLDDAALERKLAATRDYPELAAEVERAVAAHGEGIFRREALYRVEPLATLTGRWTAQPAYEHHGEQRVAAGHYTEILRHRQHFVPLMEAVLARVIAATPDAATTDPSGR